MRRCDRGRSWLVPAVLVVLVAAMVPLAVAPVRAGAQAEPAGYQALTPARVLDTRSGLGAAGPVGADGVITVKVTGVGGVPESGVGAVVLNVTATNSTAATFVTVWPTGQPRPTASNLNVTAGQSVPNLVLATVGDGGQVSLYNLAGTVDLLADVAGWFPDGSGYHGLTPSRTLDTRSDLGATGPVSADGVISVKVTGVGGVPESGVAAVVLNVTATNPTAATFVTVWPTGQPRPTASNLNVTAGQSTPNLVIATVGDGGAVSLYNYAGTVDLIADVAGWFETGSGYQALNPARILDTRSGLGATGPVGADSAISVKVTGIGGVPEGAGAVVLNVTATNPTAATFVTVSPTGQPRPTASNLNVTAGQSTPNLVIATVGDDGRVSLYNYAGTVDVIADVAGWFPAAASGPPPSSVPPYPIPFDEDTVFPLADPLSNNWIYVPGSYDESHQTPTTLFVWMHGCGGYGEGDIYTVSPGGDQDWISIALGGREGACWDPAADGSKVKAAIAEVKSHFNVDPKEVILGGYSSGGDLAYRTAFYDAGAFAGVLAEDTAPFRDTGSSPEASLAAASWKFNVVHLAHLRDEVYPIDTVRAETDAMIAAGFPLTRIERPGNHYDPPGAIVDGQPVPGTDADLVALLLPYIGAGWRSP